MGNIKESELYANIKARRKLLHMTQAELAKKVCYTDHTMISKVESGKVDLNYSTIFKFAEALETNAPELMGWL